MRYILIALFYTIGFLHARSVHTGIKPVYNVVIAIDNSGSMDDSVWAIQNNKRLSDPEGYRFIAAELAINILSQLQVGDTLTSFNTAAFSFASNTVLLHPRVKLRNKLTTKEVIDSIYSERNLIRRKAKTGYTNFDILFQKTIKMFSGCNKENSSSDTLLCHNVLIVITDGNIDGISDKRIVENGYKMPKNKIEKRRLKEKILKNLAGQLRKNDIKLYMILIGHEALKDTSLWNYFAKDITGGDIFYLRDVKNLISYIFKIYRRELPVSQFNVPKLSRTHKLLATSEISDTFLMDSINYPYLDELKFMIFVSSLAPISDIQIITPGGEIYKKAEQNPESPVVFTTYRYTHAVAIKKPSYGKWGIKIRTSKPVTRGKVFININLLVKYPYLYIIYPDLSIAYPSNTKILFKGVFLSSNGIFKITNDRLKHLSTELEVISKRGKRLIYAGEFKYNKRENKFVSEPVVFPRKGEYILKITTYFYPEGKDGRTKLKMGNDRSEIIYISPIPEIVKTEDRDTVIISPHQSFTYSFMIKKRDLADSIKVRCFLEDKPGKILKKLRINWVSDTEFVVTINKSSSIPGFGLRGHKRLKISYRGELKDPKVNIPFEASLVPYVILYRWSLFDYIMKLFYILLIIVPIGVLIKKERWKRSLVMPRGILKVMRGTEKRYVGEEISLDEFGKKIVSVGLNTGDIFLEISEDTSCECLKIFSRKIASDIKTYIKVLTSNIDIIVDSVYMKKGDVVEIYDRSSIIIGDYYALEYQQEEILSW